MGETPYKYHFMRYNQYGVLRPNWLVKLILFFLCRHLLLMLAFAAMTFRRMSGADMGHLLPLLDRAYIIADLPVLMVLFVMGARQRCDAFGKRGIRPKPRIRRYDAEARRTFSVHATALSYGSF